MRKLLILTVLLCAACTKVEPLSIETKTEIGYTTIMSKALNTNQVVFIDNNVFQSYAYYLPKGTYWKYSNIAGDNGAKEYFNTDVIISKDVTNNKWRDVSHTWYWPKTYALTFFAWSLNQPTLTFPSGSSTIVGCSDQNGIVATEYDIEKNKNVDFLVADIAADKVENENMYTYTGVPTLFKHKLSQFYVTVCTKEDYSKVEFTLNKIEFENLNNKGNYTQHPDVFTLGNTKTNQTYTDQNQVINSTTPTEITKVNQYIYLPQELTNDKTITIEYTIGYDTNGDTTVDMVEKVTNTYKLSDLYGSNFNPGTKYTLNITLALNEILWDPAVEKWTTNIATL